MGDAPATARLGQKVPLFELATYDPVREDFGKFSLAEQIEKKRWTKRSFFRSASFGMFAFSLQL